MTEVQANKPAFKVALETTELIKALKKAEVGETLSYIELNAATGDSVDVQNGGRSYLNTARKTLRREDQRVFAVVRGVGLKRLANNEIAGTSQERVKKAQRQAREGMKDLACVDYGKLGEHERKEHDMQAVQLGMLELAGKAATRNKIEQLTLSQPEPPTIEQVHSLFANR